MARMPPASVETPAHWPRIRVTTAPQHAADYEPKEKMVTPPATVPVRNFLTSINAPLLNFGQKHVITVAVGLEAAKQTDTVARRRTSAVQRGVRGNYKLEV